MRQEDYYKDKKLQPFNKFNQTRTGVRQVMVPQVVRNSLGDRMLNVAFIPFIRSRTITLQATRFKPNTRLFAFFDNIDINVYVTPTGGSLGGNIVSDANAVSEHLQYLTLLTMQILDANSTRVFRLTSSSTNDRVSDIETTRADYIARVL